MAIEIATTHLDYGRRANAIGGRFIALLTDLLEARCLLVPLTAGAVRMYVKPAVPVLLPTVHTDAPPFRNVRRAAGGGVLILTVGIEAAIATLPPSCAFIFAQVCCPLFAGDAAPGAGTDARP